MSSSTSSSSSSSVLFLLCLLIIFIFSPSISSVSAQGVDDNGCANATVTSIVMAIENECSSLNNITGLATFCSLTASQGTTVLNNANNIAYVISCPPSLSNDTATGIFVQPGGQVIVTAFTQFTPTDFNDTTVNDFWCSGFRGQINGTTNTTANPAINGGSCRTKPYDPAAPNLSGYTCDAGGQNPPYPYGDFRAAGAGGATADTYCSFAGGEDHLLGFPTYNSDYSSELIANLYVQPAYEIAQGALVYRIGEYNPEGGSAYSPLFTGHGQVGQALSKGLNGQYPGYSGGNQPATNVPSTATAGPSGNALVSTLNPESSGQLYLCFWDYYNEDNYGNVHVAVTYTAPSASSACVNGDPQFTGLRGQSFQVHGIDGAVYNLITDEDLQVNARFAFLDQGECPVINGVKGTNCYSHPGSYLGEIALQQRINGEVEELRLVSGDAKVGFQTVSYNGQNLPVGGFVYATANGEKDGIAIFSVRRISLWEVEVVTPQFSFVFENSDMFINQAVRVQTSAVKSLRSHGLLGQTWSTKTYNNELKYVEGEVDDYSLPSDDIFGTDFVFNKFASSS